MSLQVFVRFPMIIMPAIACSVLLYSSSIYAQVVKRPSIDECRANLRQKDDDLLRRETLRHLEHQGDKAKAALPELLGLFAEADEELRLGAAMLVAKFGADALPELMKQLDAKDADVRYYALATLLWMGEDGRKAGERIVRALDDPSPMVRIKAIHAASLLEDDPACIKALLSILKDERADVRLAAIESLKTIGKKTALAPALYPLMSDPNREIALTALKIVVELDRSPKTLDALLQLTETESGLSIAQTEEARQAVVAYGKPAVDKLLEMLRRRPDKKGAYVSFNVATMIGLIGAPHADEAVPTLSEMLLADDDRSYAMVYALAKLGKTKTLVDAANNPKLSVNLRVLCMGQLHGAGSESIATLVQLAGSKDVKIRRAAIGAFYFVRPANDAVIKTFIGALHDDDVAVRLSAVMSLREFWWMLKDRADVLDGIRTLLLDEDENVAAWAYIIYPEMGGNNHRALEKFLDSAKDAERLRAAARLLEVPRSQDSKVPLARLIEIAEKGLEHKDLSLQMRCAAGLAHGRHVKLQGKLLDHFRACARHPKADVRIHAISLTSKYSTSAPDIQKEFMTLLDDKDEKVRWAALANMYNIGLDADVAMPHYQKTFTKPAHRNRDTLVGLAAKHGAKALPVLRLALKEKDTRERALQELVNLSQDDKILSEFLPEFRAALTDEGTRQTFLRFLAARHNSEANLVALAPELRKLLNEEDFQVRHATVQLLARIQFRKGEVLLQAFDAEPSAARRAEIVAALVLYPAPAILERAMKDPAALVRSAAVPLLGEPGDKATHKFLVQAMNDPNPEVRRAAALNLAAKSTPKTIAFLEDLLKQNQSKTRFSALIALTNNGAYRDKSCVKELTACLTDRSPEVRRMAIQLLARIDRDTLPILAKVAAQDVDEDVRHAAKQVLSPPPP